MDDELHIPEILRQPASRNELDIELNIVEDLILRRCLITDRTSTGRISREIGLSGKIVLESFEDLRRRQYLDVFRLDGNDYHFSLTSLGSERARYSTERCSYAGIAPISLDRYTKVVNLLKCESHVSQTEVHREYSDLVINDKIVERIGPAFSAQQSIFFYGPSGTGKTSIAERLVRLYDDWIVVPHAVYIDSQVISVYDPTIHKAVEPAPPGFDPRFVVCERPFVLAGGELELGMLQLKRDPISKVYAAPLQMKANGGIFLIDDFGRQLVPPGALLNRWIVPLERRVDFLSLDSGLKFPIPFEVLVVFSTNLDPSKLGDEAFFRRIQNKIYIGATTMDEFDEILVRTAQRMGVGLVSDSKHLVRMVCREFGRSRLYPCYPVDLVKLVRSICDYEEIERVVERNVLWRAAELYFTTGTGGEWVDGHSSEGVFTETAGALR